MIKMTKCSHFYISSRLATFFRKIATTTELHYNCSCFLAGLISSNLGAEKISYQWGAPRQFSPPFGWFPDDPPSPRYRSWQLKYSSWLVPSSFCRLTSACLLQLFLSFPLIFVSRNVVEEFRHSVEFPYLIDECHVRQRVDNKSAILSSCHQPVGRVHWKQAHSFNQFNLSVLRIILTAFRKGNRRAAMPVSENLQTHFRTHTWRAIRKQCRFVFDFCF